MREKNYYESEEPKWRRIHLQNFESWSTLFYFASLWGCWVVVLLRLSSTANRTSASPRRPNWRETSTTSTSPNVKKYWCRMRRTNVEPNEWCDADLYMKSIWGSKKNLLNNIICDLSQSLNLSILACPNVRKPYSEPSMLSILSHNRERNGTLAAASKLSSF